MKPASSKPAALVVVLAAMLITSCAGKSPATEQANVAPDTAVATSVATRDDSQKPLYYTPMELANLDTCAGYANVATLAAHQRLKGVPIEAVKEQYKKAKNYSLYEAVINETYQAKFYSERDFGLAYFKGCAMHIANLQPKRIDRASFCMQSQLIAEVVWAAKQRGEPADDIRKKLGSNNKVIPMIVNEIYSKNDERVEQAAGRIWSDCIHSFHQVDDDKSPAN